MTNKQPTSKSSQLKYLLIGYLKYYKKLPVWLFIFLIFKDFFSKLGLQAKVLWWQNLFFFLTDDDDHRSTHTHTHAVSP